MKFLLISLFTVLSLTTYASNEEDLVNLVDLNNECHQSCLDKTSMHRIDPQNLEDTKRMPFCSEEAAQLFNLIDTPVEMPQEAVALQNCLISESISCIKKCNKD